MSEQQRWNDPLYQRMSAVRCDDGWIRVGFKDGTEAAVKASRLLPNSATRPLWSGLEFDDYEIRVPVDTGTVEIPWSTVRALTDVAYSAHLVEESAEQARLIGRQIKSLRKQRGLTGKYLAERAGITPQSLSRIEHGHHDVVFTTLRRILAAMGCSVADLAEPRSEAASSRR